MYTHTFSLNSKIAECKSIHKKMKSPWFNQIKLYSFKYVLVPDN